MPGAPVEVLRRVPLVEDLSTIAAATDLVCWRLTYWGFRPLVQGNGVIGWKLVQSLAKKLREARQGE